MKQSIAVYVDFDGTITQSDVIDFLLEALADPSWREIENEWDAGKITARQCMASQIPLIQGGWKSIEKSLAQMEIDNTFPSFLCWCKENHIKVSIVSDGLDRVINYILNREGLIVDSIMSNRLDEHVESETKECRLSLAFPFASDDKNCASGVCKCKVINESDSNTLKVMIGDGSSDFCWAQQADLVFAKSKLAEYCAEKGIAFQPFADFKNIQCVLEPIRAQIAMNACCVVN